MDIKPAIVAILNTKNAIVGTGFVAADCLIVTCAHVIEAAQSAPGGHVRIRFAVDDSERFAEVDSRHYSPRDAQDVAILRVSQMPKGVRTGRLAAAENCRPGHPFQSFGYALAADVQGIIARGAIDGYFSKPPIVATSGPAGQPRHERSASAG